jgi:hypothetical protein
MSIFATLYNKNLFKPTNYGIEEMRYNMKYLNKLRYRWILCKLGTMDFRGLWSMTNITLHYGTLLPSYHEIPVIYQIQKVHNLTIKGILSYRSNIPFDVRQSTMKFKNLCTWQTTKPAMSVLITNVYGSRVSCSPGSSIFRISASALYIICNDFRTWHWPVRNPAPTQPQLHSWCLGLYQVHQYSAMARSKQQ